MRANGNTLLRHRSTLLLELPQFLRRSLQDTVLLNKRRMPRRILLLHSRHNIRRGDVRVLLVEFVGCGHNPLAEFLLGRPQLLLGPRQTRESLLSRALLPVICALGLKAFGRHCRVRRVASRSGKLTSRISQALPVTRGALLLGTPELSQPPASLAHGQFVSAGIGDLMRRWFSLRLWDGRIAGNFGNRTALTLLAHCLFNASSVTGGWGWPGWAKIAVGVAHRMASKQWVPRFPPYDFYLRNTNIVERK